MIHDDDDDDDDDNIYTVEPSSPGRSFFHLKIIQNHYLASLGLDLPKCKILFKSIYKSSCNAKFVKQFGLIFPGIFFLPCFSWIIFGMEEIHGGVHR